MVKRALPLLFFLSFVASSASAMTVDALLGKVKTVEQAVQSDGADDERANKESIRESAHELFPSVDAAAASGSVVAGEEGFVTFKEYGAVVTLKDVPRQAWFAPYVRDVAEQHIVSGYRGPDGKPLGEFRPGNPVTVEEIAKMFVLASGKDASSCPQKDKNFTTATGSWSIPFVACAETGNWVLFGDGTVDVHRPATRAEVVVTLLQAFGVPERDPALSFSHFSDVTPATFFGAAILTAADDGIVSGYTDESGKATGGFGPTTTINRAEVAKIISNALQKYRK